ncbi:MAG TPA: hypothetical protein VMW16_15775 [Sedimentisphaerales bacterium]|nr:hypothetical protein [Sedimentisphaerales bacterium]
MVRRNPFIEQLGRVAIGLLGKFIKGRFESSRFVKSARTPAGTKP